jgi:hypothetical protein
MESVDMEHHPVTEEQRRYLDQDLKAATQNLENIASVLRGCYGETDRTVIRAEEATGAVQRLIWAVERQQAKGSHAGWIGS